MTGIRAEKRHRYCRPYIDRATTGTNDNREQFQKMLKDSDKKSFDYVLVET